MSVQLQTFQRVGPVTDFSEGRVTHISAGPVTHFLSGPVTHFLSGPVTHFFEGPVTDFFLFTPLQPLHDLTILPSRGGLRRDPITDFSKSQLQTFSDYTLFRQLKKSVTGKVCNWVSYHEKKSVIGSRTMKKSVIGI